MVTGAALAKDSSHCIECQDAPLHPDDMFLLTAYGDCLKTLRNLQLPSIFAVNMLP